LTEHRNMVIVFKLITYKTSLKATLGWI